MPGSCQVVGLARCLGLDWFLRQGQHCSWTTVRIGGECSVGGCPVPTLALAVAAVALAIALAIAILSRLYWMLHGGVLGSGALGLVSGSPALVSGWPGLVSRCSGLLGIPDLLPGDPKDHGSAELRTRPWEDQLEP